MNELYVNIGSVKCCLFVKMSILLLKTLEMNRLMYYAVEEALECAKIGYYGIGTLTFAQLLNVLNCKTPVSRHVVAHQILRQKPTKEAFEEAVEAFKSAASLLCERELYKNGNFADYQQKIVSKWEEFIRNNHVSSGT